MKPAISHLALGCVIGLMATNAASQTAPVLVPPSSPVADAHIAAARAAGGVEWKGAVDQFCSFDPPVNLPSDPVETPTKVFDNLYYVGLKGTGSWIVKTSAGLVLIDTGYQQHLHTVLLPGMAAFDLNPADVKFILTGHGAYDHFGGSRYFQDKYGTRVVMGVSSPGWPEVENFESIQAARSNAPPRLVQGRVYPNPPPGYVPPKFDPKRDIKWSGRGELTVGDTTFTIVDNPEGVHIVFPVKDGATTHMAGLYASTILIPKWRRMEGLRNHLQTLASWSETAKQMNVDVEIQNHPFYDGTTEKLAAIRSRKSGQQHPFVVGQAVYQRFIKVMSECMQAQIAWREAAGER